MCVCCLNGYASYAPRKRVPFIWCVTLHHHTLLRPAARPRLLLLLLINGVHRSLHPLSLGACRGEFGLDLREPGESRTSGQGGQEDPQLDKMRRCAAQALPGAGQRIESRRD